MLQLSGAGVLALFVEDVTTIGISTVAVPTMITIITIATIITIIIVIIGTISITSTILVIIIIIAKETLLAQTEMDWFSIV